MRARVIQAAIVLSTFLAAGASGCFPDYSFAPSDTDASAGAGGSAGAAGTGGAAGSAGTGGGTTPEDMARIDPPDTAYVFRVRTVDGMFDQTASVKLSEPFYVDVYEVTVDRYQAWLNDPRRAPCESGTCTLDEGGSYESTMVWDAEWNAYLQPHTLLYEAGMGCTSPEMPDDRTTWEIAIADSRPELPMTCVSWYEAAAFCAWEGKRLLTQAEWVYVASGGHSLRAYPWGSDDPTSCDQAVWRANATFCGFPVEVGSTGEGRTEDGVYDMAGSVFEWVWDVAWTEAPQGATDFTGPSWSAGSSRIRRGGAYLVPEFPGDDRLKIETYEPWNPDAYVADAGFRCAQSIR